LFNSKLNGRKLKFNTPLKGGIYSFPAWRSAFTRVNVEIGRQQVRLLCPWVRHVMKLPLPLSVRLETGSSLIRNTEKVLRCLLVEIP